MNLKELIHKEILTTDEMLFVVEKYIEKRKGVKVQINLMKGLDNVPELMKRHLLIEQLQLLQSAYMDAIDWIIKNKNYD